MDDPRSSIYVPPLHIKKSSSTLLEALRNDGADTVVDTEPAVATLLEQGVAPPRSHNYLRAVYPFAPSNGISPNTISLALDAGDLILIHSVHTNGWADGTLLHSGERGWLPTNYCETYEEDSMWPLLKALMDFWEVLRMDRAASSDFHSQDYLRGLIAGVRFLLEHCNCLTRDSPLVRAHSSLRRLRKSLLSDLSLFVRAGKRLETAHPESSVSVPYELLDEMLLRAFKIVNRGVRFLDVWVTDSQIIDGSQFILPAAGDDGAEDIPDNGNFAEPHPQHIKSQWEDRQWIAADLDYFSPQKHPRVRSFKLPGEQPSSPVGQLPPSHRALFRNVSMDVRASRLTAGYDTFLGALASLLGSHMLSRSPGELLLTAQQAVKACRDLLSVLDAIPDPNGQLVNPLLELRELMCDRVEELVSGARQGYQIRDLTHDDPASFSEGIQRLVDTAGLCVTAAGECMAQTRMVPVLSGDVEAEPETPTSGPDSLTESVPTRSHASSDVAQERVSFNNVTEQADGAQSRTLDPSSDPQLTEFAKPTEQVDSLAATSFQESNTLHSRRGPQAESLQRQKSLVRTIIISTGSGSSCFSSSHDFTPSVVSASSTRATSMDDVMSRSANEIYTDDQPNSAKDASGWKAEPVVDIHVEELMSNNQGQVIGGTVRALLEKLIGYNSSRESLFTTAFLLTFRLYVSPEEFAKALVEGLHCIRSEADLATSRLLRVFLIFKWWLESYWRHDCDDPALPIIVGFARTHLLPVFAENASVLLDLTTTVSATGLKALPRVGMTAAGVDNSIAPPDTPVPSSIISRSQMLSLRTWKLGGAVVAVTDFDPLELARQITLKVSRLFCAIMPEELLATEWQKRSGSLAVNVTALSTLSTDIANLVADSILQLTEPKKRAAVLKQWVKIAARCLDLNNFDTLMAIICSLNSTTIRRMRKTWDVVSHKTKNTLEELSKIVDVSRNSVVLRQRLQVQKPPCLPFVGMYLTDLTFVDHGNPMTRQMETEHGPMSVVNFDKHMKTARIIYDLQRFQVPYHLHEVPELQIWMQVQLVRVRSVGETSFQNHYRRSLLLEPKEQLPPRAASTEPATAKDRDRFDFFAWTHTIKDKTTTPSA